MLIIYNVLMPNKQKSDRLLVIYCTKIIKLHILHVYTYFQIE